jgi:hypothetical protein
MAVILACIPLLRPLLGRITYSNGTSGATGDLKGRLTPSAALDSKITAEDRKRPFEPLDDDSSQYHLRPLGPKHQAEVLAGVKTMSVNSSAGGSYSAEERELTERSIKVKSQWEVDVERR